MIAPSVVSSKIISEMTWVWAFTAEGSVNKHLRRSIWENWEKSSTERPTQGNPHECFEVHSGPESPLSYHFPCCNLEEKKKKGLSGLQFQITVVTKRKSSSQSHHSQGWERRNESIHAACLLLVHSARSLLFQSSEPSLGHGTAHTRVGLFPSINKQDSPAQAHPQAYCSRQSLTEILQWGTSGLCQGDSYN